MSLPQTVCRVPLGEQASVIVSPSLPFIEVAFASQVVGFAAPSEDGGVDAGLELAAELFVWPAVVTGLLSLFSFEQAGMAMTIAASSTNQRLLFDRSNFLVLSVGITRILSGELDVGEV